MFTRDKMVSMSAQAFEAVERKNQLLFVLLAYQTSSIWERKRKERGRGKESGESEGNGRREKGEGRMAEHQLAVKQHILFETSSRTN